MADPLYHGRSTQASSPSYDTDAYGATIGATIDPRLVDQILMDLVEIRLVVTTEPAMSRLDSVARDLAAAAGFRSSVDLGRYPGFPGWRTLATCEEGQGYDELRWLIRVLPANRSARAS